MKTEIVPTYVATKNDGKLAELRAIFAGSQLQLKTYPPYGEVAEGETSYAENALLKARALARQLRAAGISGAVLADDSGLEVQALGGRPGVLSARYGGADATWPQRRAKLLDEMREVADAQRGARFVCAIAFIDASGSERVVLGEASGSIVRAATGLSGFGYDPLFFYPPAGRSFGQLTAKEKNRFSHRFAAARMLLAELAQRG